MVKINIQRPIMPSGYALSLGNRIWSKLTIHKMGFRIDRVKNRIMIGLS